jgi:hypothetical protein
MLFGWMRTTRRYVTEQAFQKNLRNQLAGSPRTLEQLLKLGVPRESCLRLEVFFYSDSEERAQNLAGHLSESGYEVSCQPSAHDERLWLVNGWSTPVRMTETSVLEWTGSMCRVGFDHDCKFDGWGTFPDQSQIPARNGQGLAGSV